MKRQIISATSFLLLCNLSSLTAGIPLEAKADNMLEEEPSSISIDLTDPIIKISGSNYTSRTSNKISFQRFSDEILTMPILESKLNAVKAHTTSGIVISFKTSSPAIHLEFTVEEGENRGHKYAVHQNGLQTQEFSFSNTAGPALTLNISSSDPGQVILYEITMPNWSITSLSDLSIEEGHSLLLIDDIPKPVYVAYGNSITHGTGQNGTHKTYPYIVSRLLDLELFNVAVGGAKTSVPVAEMLRDDFKNIDYMTMLIGYNDYNGEGITAEEYQNRYLSFLRTFRELHQNTIIYCLSMTYTTTDTSVKTGIPADDFRQVVIDLVDLLQTEGDENIFLIHGDSISSEINLNDAVHFSEPGAALFADSLALEMGKKSQFFNVEDTLSIRRLVSGLFPSGGLVVGSACHENLLGTNSSTILDREFAYVTPANDFKQSYIHPEPGIWKWEKSNTWVNHCRDNGQLIRMHAPISPQCSKWVKDDSRTAAELELMLKEYMVGLCTHYNDTSHIKWLDVVNETISSDGSWFGPKAGVDKWENPWPLIGYDETVALRPPIYIKQAFEFANLYAPDLKLIINQHGAFEEVVWDKMKELVLYLRNLGLRVDGVGWQAHIDHGWEKGSGNMERLGEFIDWCHQNDLEFHITEFNVWLRSGSEMMYEEQSDTFYEIVKLVASKHNTGIVGINFWHIRGADTANPDRDGCLWTDAYEAKQAYYDVKKAIIEVARSIGPDITSTPELSALIAQNYSYQLRLRGSIGTPNYEVFTNVDWLTIDQNGLLSGTPTILETVNVTIVVSDNLGPQSQHFSLTIIPTPIEITSTPILIAREGELYEYQVTYTGEGAFSVQTNESITWLSIDQNGLLSGIPNTTGSISIIVKLSNDYETISQEFSLEIEESIGINNKVENIIEIYPNPATSYFYINHLNIGSEIVIYDLLGNEVLRKVNIGSPDQIDVSEVHSGPYIVKINGTENKYSELLMISR